MPGKESTSTLTVAGRSVRVTRRRQKHMYLRINKCEIIVTAPSHTSDYAIVRFVASKEAWIDRNLEEQVLRLQNQWNRLSVTEGDTITIFGCTVILRNLTTASSNAGHGRATQDWVLEPGVLYLRKLETMTEQKMRRVLTGILRDAVEAIRPQWEALVGRQIKTLRIRPMVSRWGSCRRATGAVTLNLYLVHLDQQFLTYVLVHELTHLHVHGHGPDFYRRMDRYLPDWQTTRRALNQWICS